jgi:putative transposase
MPVTVSFRVKKPLQCSLSQFVDGLKTVKSKLSKEGDLDHHLTLFLASTLILNKRGKCVVLEPSKNTSLTSKIACLLGKILKGKNFKPFWNEKCLEESKDLWIPEGVNVAKEDNLPFWMAEETTSHINSSFTSTKSGLRTLKVRLYPTPEQRKIFKEWMRTTRWLWNKVLGRVEQENLKKDFFGLRTKFVTSKNNPEVEEWQTKTPVKVRDGAIKDLVTSYKSSFSNLRNGNINQFKIGFKSKKRCEYPTITIPKSGISTSEKLYIYKRYIKTPIKFRGDIKPIKYDCKLSFDGIKWFLSIPYEKSISTSYAKDTCVALDPGVRNFMVGYSTSEAFKVKVNHLKFKKLLRKMDLLQSLRDLKKIKKRSWKYKRKRLTFRISNLVNEVHYKTIKKLEKFEKILLPSFESQGIVKRSRNNFLNRNIIQLKHFRFQERLKDHIGDRLIIVGEEYTSKTCGVCGFLSEVGSSEVFKCGNCTFTCDRDVNGARNIYLKHFYGS